MSTTYTTDTVTTTAKEIAAEVLRLGAERPDHKNPESRGTCVYQIDHQPACIIGCALSALGVPAEVMEVWDTVVANEYGASFRALVERGNVILEDIDDEDEAEALFKLQLNADTGSTWGYAVMLAEADPLKGYKALSALAGA